MTSRPAKAESAASRVRLLDRLAWDFAEYDTSDSFSRVHWYPATFVPQLPRVLIEALSIPGATVIDPFCGSGTTAAEAIRLGRNVVAADVNPIARLITSARLELLRADETLVSELRLAQKVTLEGARSAQAGFSLDGPPKYEAGSAMAELALWYHPATLHELHGIYSALSRVEYRAARTVLTAVLSSVARSLSSQTKSWGHIADNVRPREFVYKSAEDYLSRAFEAMIRSVERLPPSLFSGQGFGLVAAADARHLPLPASSVDLVVTSYPYPEMSDYVLAQRLSLLWLSVDPDATARVEIGARRRRFRSTSLQEFLEDMRCAFSEIVRITRPSGYVAIVGPAYDQDDPRSEVVADLLSGLGRQLSLVKEVDRTIPSSRKRQSWGTLKRERIAVFYKDE